MADFRPFCGIRPKEELAARVAALPYDVFDRREAKLAAAEEPLSFLTIDRPETQFPDGYDMYAPEVYDKAGELLLNRIADGTFLEDPEPAYYIYELTWQGHVQTGIVGCASVEDYWNGVIRRHEETRKKKETDRVRHIDACGAHTGPVLLAYRRRDGLKDLLEQEKQKNPLYAFTAKDGVRHRVWKVGEPEKTAKIREALQQVERVYIADGHHRAAAAARIAMMHRLAEMENSTGEEEYNFFLSVLFPEEELRILPYHRLVTGWNGHSKKELLRLAQEWFEVEETEEKEEKEEKPYQPKEKGVFGMYLAGRWNRAGCWYRLRPNTRLRRELAEESSPRKRLDVSILQDKLLDPVFGIKDPRTNGRISFAGGSRGLEVLQKGAPGSEYAAFSMYPTSMEELLAVADGGGDMPPKSTWFEPKLLSGLFLHRLQKQPGISRLARF